MMSTGDRRSWTGAALWSALVMGALLVLAVGVNLLIGRRIHWDIVGVFGVGGLLVLAFARRRGIV